jgi:DNA-binding CsgD family transcriptional regulator
MFVAVALHHELCVWEGLDDLLQSGCIADQRRTGLFGDVAGIIGKVDIPPLRSARVRQGSWNVQPGRRSLSGPTVKVALPSAEPPGPEAVRLYTVVTQVLLEDYVRYLRQRGLEDSYQLLTDRARQVLQLLAEGRSNKDVANLLSLGLSTVETHRTNLMQKLNLHSTAELVLYAVRKRIIS